MTPDLCLVSMPYGALTVPSISIGLLLAEARAAGIAAQGVYASLWFAESIGIANYAVLSDLGVPEDLTGEWTFAGAAFPGFEPDHDDFLRSRAERFAPFFGESNARETLWRIRLQAERFVEEAAQRVLELQPRIVGCSSTFEQQCASLALLRRVKELRPDVVTMIGGANCAGGMGLMTRRAFPWVDVVVSGEADHLFVALCHLVLDHRSELDRELPQGVFGPAAAVGGRAAAESALVTEPVTDLDRLPVPYYDDYFRELAAFAYREFVRPGLLIETSRGCWWGQKHRCSFCGLFDGALKYRSKSPDRVLNELRSLHSRHSIAKFATTDLILDMRYFASLLPRLAAPAGAERGGDATSDEGDAGRYLLYCETKANLNEEQVSLLAAAGVRWIQPGIESLHDGFLKLVNKGTSALVNLTLLKFALENGVGVVWNLLVGAPGAADEWYGEMASWLPLIRHLQPPASIVPIRYDRFSRYFEEPGRYGLALEPHRSYGYVYPLAPHELRELAYFFEDGRQQSDRSKGPGLSLLRARVKEWRRLHNAGGAGPAMLVVHEGKDESIVSDCRDGASSEIVLHGFSDRIHRACRVPRKLESLARLVDEGAQSTERLALDDAVESLIARGLLLRLGDRVLTLATRPPRRPLLSMRDFPAGFHYAIVNREAATRKQSLLKLAEALGT